MINEVFARRFNELEQAYGQIRFKPNGGGMSGTHVASGEWQRWATSAQNLLLAVFGEKSPHYTNFLGALTHCVGYDESMRAMQGIFLAAKDDFDGGYVFNVDLRVSGEVFGDFVVLAKQALANGKKDVAAVLACAALEDALKRYAASNGIDTTEKTMQEVVNSLKGKGLVAGAQKSLLDTMPRIRNLALHADWDKLSEPDVNSVIGFVEQFLLSKFGGG
jgi:hypothetical protein